MRQASILFIINPKSGTESKQSVEMLIPECLPPHLFSCQLRYTAYAGHASLLAEEGLRQGVDIIVAVGGDGTVNEVARSMRHSAGALGIIPSGSGNGLARHLGIPLSPREALQLIARRSVEALDYGEINGHPFFCTCGVGFDAFVSERFASSLRRGFLTYVQEALTEAMRYKAETYTVDIDGQSQRMEALLIACGNASQYGNNVYIAPEASMTDGLLDVTVMQPFPLAEAPQIALQLLSKRIGVSNRVRTFRCKELRIHREKEGVVHFDGDPVTCGSELTIRAIPKGIRMVTNPNPRSFTPPFASAFADILGEMRQEIAFIQEDINLGRKRIMRLNASLLSRLRER